VTIRELIDHYFFKYRVHSFPVVNKGQDHLVGHITAKAIRSLNRDTWNQMKVSEAMTPVDQLPRLTTDQDAFEVLQQMLIHDHGRLPVVDADSGALAGIITRKDIFEYVHMREEIEGDEPLSKRLPGEDE
jgi:CBS domain-containing protein